MDLFYKIKEITEEQSPPDIAHIKIREFDLGVASCFRLGLQGELESRVKLGNPSSLQDAINIAIEAERNLNHRNKLFGISGNNKSAANSNTRVSARESRYDKFHNEKNKAVNHIQEEKRPRSSQRQKSDYDSRASSIDCYTCGERGHYSRNCPRRTGPKRKRSRSRSRGRGEPSYKEIKCGYCQYRGHESRNCFRRRAEETEKKLERLEGEIKSEKPNMPLNSQQARRQGATTSWNNSTARQP
ncbi:uncharacterized protein LOC117178665 [Belonocnema kinseyi]|uniref:uncharacterized protein LOC117178665 n=1 Tax=Belonocnema kinseyi TaxID=2817044 RepID=UPI00143DA8C5|nr:uncharacterized protein LOC117178665 [Belonocnema kinseyi]